MATLSEYSEYENYYRTQRPLMERINAKIRREWAARVDATTLHIPQDFKGVSFCFDDCPVTATTAGAKILEESNARGTYYICFDLIGKPSPSGVIVSRADLANISARGHEIGCHTFDHTNCSYATPDAVNDSCETNKRQANEQGFSLDNFSYPQGGMTVATKRIMRKRFTSARTVMPGINRGRADAHALRAMSLYESSCAHTIKSTIEDVSKNGGWLMLYTHDVCAEPSRYGVSEQKFRDVVNTCSKNGLEIMTVGNALARIQKKA